ncbi:FAD-dependent oxidoreductase [Agromyces sp. NPDC055520]
MPRAERLEIEPGPARSDDYRLDPDQLARLAEYGYREQVRPGQVLSRTGDRRYDLFLVESGSIDVICDANSVRPERTISTRGAGDFTGELGMLTGQLVFLTLRVQEPGVVVRIGQDGFRAAMNEQADIADVLLAAFGQRRRVILDMVSSVAEIVGAFDCADNRALRTYAARQQLPHTAVDADSIAGQALLSAHGLTTADLPVVLVADQVLRRATPHDLAGAVGFTYAPGGNDVDLVVIGAGPAGLAAAVYAASEGLVTVLFDTIGAGGQAATSSRIENYLGFPRGVSGDELAQSASMQALKFGAQLYTPCEVVGLSPSGPAESTVTLRDGAQLRARAAIIATGAHYRRLNVPRRDHFERLGQIRYSATELDARDCRSQPVTVVGGANSAGQAALFLASRGSRVDLVVRGAGIDASMSAYLARRIEAQPLVRLWVQTEVMELIGADTLEAVVLRGGNGAPERRESAIVFCLIGAVPDTGWLVDVARDDDGFILTDTQLAAQEPAAATAGDLLPFQTSAGRVFAVGDVRAGSMKRVASAVGEGAGAVASVHKLLARDRVPR